jgi:hypothetical protein
MHAAVIRCGSMGPPFRGENLLQLMSGNDFAGLRTALVRPLQLLVQVRGGLLLRGR